MTGVQTCALPIWAVATPGAVAVFLAGATHRFVVPDPLAAGEEAAGGEDVLRAPLPGVVRAIHVAEGESVAEGARLVTLEAMKMEHSLRAPRSGVVAELPAAEGDAVAEGAVLAALAPQDG